MTLKLATEDYEHDRKYKRQFPINMQIHSSAESCPQLSSLTKHSIVGTTKIQENKFQSQRPLTTSIAGSNSTNNLQIRVNFTRPTHHKEEDMEKQSTKEDRYLAPRRKNINQIKTVLTFGIIERVSHYKLDSDDNFNWF